MNLNRAMWFRVQTLKLIANSTLDFVNHQEIYPRIYTFKICQTSSQYLLVDQNPLLSS